MRNNKRERGLIHMRASHYRVGCLTTTTTTTAAAATATARSCCAAVPRRGKLVCAPCLERAVTRSRLSLLAKERQPKGGGPVVRGHGFVPQQR